jgi:hypothetical protein
MKKRSLLFGFGLMLAFSGSLEAQVNLSGGLAACYTFDGNAQDMSGNGNHGTINGASPASDRMGNPNSAYSFDGTNDYIEISNDVISSSEFSVSFWSRADQLKSHIAFMLVPDNPADRLSISVNYSHNGSPAIFWDFGNIFGSGRSAIYPASTIGMWEHYVFVSSASGDSMLIFRNGILLSGEKKSSPISDTTRTLRIGSGNNANFFLGLLDDIRIYHRVLNRAEISALYNNASSCSPVAVEKTTSPASDISIYPNPSNGPVTLKVPPAQGSNYSLEIFDISGKMLREIRNIQGPEHIVEREDLSKGFYLYRLKTGQESISNGKLILH